jgi:hypothetical protein
VRRVQVERHLEALLSLATVTQLLFERPTDAVVHLDALRAVAGEIGHPRHRLDGLRGVALLLVQLAQGLERRNVGIVEIDDVPVGIDGAVDVADFFRVDLGDRTVQLDLRRRAGRFADVTLVSVDQIQPLLEAAVAALQAQVGALFCVEDLERLLVALSRNVELEEMLLLVLRNFEQHLDALALGLDDLELTLEDGDEVGPILDGLIDALQTAQGEQIAAVELEHLAVHLARAIEVTQRCLVQAGHAQLGGGDLLSVAEPRHLGGEDLDELGVVLALVVDLLQRAERRQVVRVHLERAPVVSQTLIGLVHVLVQQLAQVEQNGLAVVVCRRHVERALQGLADLLPGRPLAMDGGHLPQHLDVVRIERDDLRVVRLRVLEVPEILAVPLA